MFACSGYNPDDVVSVEGRTYTLNCKGKVGNMLYITDLDYDSEVGHNLAEVEVYIPGRVGVIEFSCCRKQYNFRCIS